MKSMSNLLLTLILGLFCLQGVAQDVSFTAAAPAKVGVGQNFQVQYTLSAQGSNIKAGNYSDFKLISGPSTSTSQNVTIVNGQYSQKYTYTFTYVFQAKAVGKYTIGGATVTSGGKQYTSNSVSIEVQQEPVQTQNSKKQNTYDPWANFYNQTQPKVTEAPKEITGEDLFVRVIADKTSLYKGEPLIVTLKLYSKVNLSGISDLKLPNFDSFYTEELEAPTRWTFAKETYNGKTYDAALIKRYLLYPRVAGNVVIEPCEVDCEIRQPIAGANNYWAQFYGYYENVSKKIKSPEIKINVKNLPPASDDFSGAIGSFSLKMSQSEDTVNINDAVTFKLTLSGTGNFNMIETPEIIWPKEFEVYDPVANLQTTASTAGVNGSKSWEFTAIPRYPGIYRLGKVNFLYFDSNTRQYKTLTTNEIVLAVRKDKNDTNFGEKDYNYSQKNVEYIGDQEIRFIKNKDLGLKKNYKPLINKGFFSLLFIIPLLIFIAVSVLLRKKIKENANIALMKVKRAGKTSRKRLKRARQFMLKKNKSEFYKEIISALWGYSGDRFGIPVSELSKEKTIAVLEATGSNPEMIDKLIKLIEKCEYCHFAPASPETELEYIYSEAVEIIEELEQKIK